MPLVVPSNIDKPILESGKFIDALYYQSIHNPNKPLLKLYEEEEVTLTYFRFNNLVNGACHLLRDTIKDGVKLNEDGYVPISYLANSSQHYPLNLMALIKLNLTPVILSPKNSVDIQVHLINESGSQTLVYDNDNREQALECKKILPWLTIVEQIKINNIEEFNTEVSPLIQIKPKTENFSDDILLILHSSGSTSNPKLIKKPNRCYFRWAEIAQGEIKGKLVGNGLLIAPFYHSFGLGQFFNSILTSSCLSIPTFSSLSPSQILKEAKLFKCTYLVLLPFIIKELFDYCSENKQYWKQLSDLTCILTAGALLPKQLNKESIKNGVHIINAYGLTEVGYLAINVTPTGDDDMDYMKLVKGVDYELVNIQDDTFQLKINLKYKGLASNVINFGEDGFIVGDLFRIIEHDASKDHLIFQILGRQDDTIIHINGEKTNPLPIEGEIISNPYIKHCLVYGTSKLFNCAIIELNKEAAFIPLFKLTNSILSQIEKANKQNPSHSRIFPELVHVLPFETNKSFIITPKGNMVRKKNEALFEEEINQLYLDFDNVQRNNSGDVEDIHGESKCSAERIINLFFGATGKQIDADNSFFKSGMDSLSVVKFRNLILSKYPNVELSINNIYESDSAKSLTEFINNNFNNFTSIKTLKEYQEEVDNLIEKYTDFTNGELRESKQKKTEGLKVLITGANGSLGNFIIQALLQRSEVNHIYALSRSTTSEQSRQRLKQGFESRLIKLNSEQWSKITALPYQIDDDKLGLDDIIYSKIKDEVDVIYHNAWTMDFLKGVRMFEDCIKGTVNLLKISANSENKPRFHFVSSVGASMPVNVRSSLIEQPLNTELKNANSCNGYNLSKLITETIALKYSKNYNFNLNIHRVGQISGDSINGAWNVREYLPLLIKGIQVMKVAPKSFMNISWIPVDYAARGMVEVNFNEGSNINHIVNPKVFSFDVILDALKSYGFEFEIIENEKFIKILKKQEYQNVDINPIASLTDFFTKSLHNTSYSLVMETKQTELRADAIKNCPPIDQALLFKYIEFWKSSGFIN